MSIDPITKTVSNIPLLRKRGTVNPSSQADKDDFVTKYEATNDHLANNTVIEINTVISQTNTTIGQINTTIGQFNTVASEVATNATIADDSAGIALQAKTDIKNFLATLPVGTINNSVTGLTNTWSASKISSDLALKLNATNPSITGSITEKVYNLTGTKIDPTNGTIQYKTVSSNTTFTETLTAGQSVLLRLISANSYTIVFPTITWVGAVAPILTANCAIVIWKEQATLYGAYVGTLV